MAGLDAFMRRFVASARREWRVDGPAFTLILGAGASRSSGVPMAGEMVCILQRLAALDRISIPRKPARETSLSWFFRHVTERLKWVDEFSDYSREFIMACISRAGREPNLAHLIAAHLSAAHIIGDIVTTNFDDLTPAAFWNLPASTAYVEPHVVYHPRAELSTRAAPGVPVIIKAHGHHTIYGLDVIDRDIKAAASFVKRILAARPKPEIGYLVVGYSGGWPDGIIATLRDPRLTRGKTIYWFHVGQEPEGPNIEAIKRSCDVIFIRILDADVLFLRMWHEVHADEEMNNPPLFESYHLFNLSPSFQRVRPASETIEKWWDVWEIPESASQMRNHPRLLALRRELLPLLKAIDKWDDDCLFFDCAPAGFRHRIGKLGYASSWIQPPELAMLAERVPADIVWTRRNRKLLKLALTNHVDPVMPYILLSALRLTQR